MEVEVSKSKNGDLFVLAEDGFAASFKNGKWTEEILFDQYQMRDDFTYIDDELESQRIFKEALVALEHDSVVA